MYTNKIVKFNSSLMIIVLDLNLVCKLYDQLRYDLYSGQLMLKYEQNNQWWGNGMN